MAPAHSKLSRVLVQATTAIFNSWITKDVRASVPVSFKVVIDGTPAANVTAKDYMLDIVLLTFPSQILRSTDQ